MKRIPWFLAIAAAVSALGCASESGTGMRRVAFIPTPHGAPKRVLASGTTVFLPNGETWAGLQVIDAANAQEPRRVAHIDVANFCRDGARDGDRIYTLASFNGVTIIDVSRATRPRTIGHYRVAPPANHGDRLVAFTQAGRRYFYVNVFFEGGWKDWPAAPAHLRPGVRLVDATDATKPVAVELPSNVPLFDRVSDGLGYHAANGNLRVYDLRDSAAPEIVATVPLGDDVRGFTVDGRRVYVLLGSWLQVFDVSDPANVRRMGGQGLERITAIDVAAAAGRVVVLGASPDGSGSVMVLEPMPPSATRAPATQAATTQAGTQPTTRPGRGRRARLGLVGRIAIPTSSIKSVTIEGGRAYVSDADVGFWIVDLAKPEEPRLAGVYVSAGEAQHLLVQGSTGLLNLQWGGNVAIVDLSDPPRARITGYYLPDRPNDYADFNLGRWFYYGRGAVRDIVDISNASRPLVVGQFTPIPGAGAGVVGEPTMPMVRHGEVAFVIGRRDGRAVVVAYDVSDPPRPRRVGELSLGDGREYFAAVTDGQTLYVGAAGMLRALDVRDPANMAAIAELADESLNRHLRSYTSWHSHGPWQGAGRRLALAHGHLYMLEGDEESDDPRLLVFDVSDRARIRRVHTSPEAPTAFQEDWFDNRIVHQGDMWTDMIAHGHRLYVCDYWGGVRVFDLRDPARPAPVFYEFQPFLDILPSDWSRQRYRAALEQAKDGRDDLHRVLGITQAAWKRRDAVGERLGWAPMVYHPGYELCAWNIGAVVNGYLVQPKLGGLAVYRVDGE